MRQRKTHIYKILFFIGSVLLLIAPAIENGFPLLFSDSGTYLVSGQIDYVPVDRPIIYGLFVRHISLSWSVWLPVIVQSLILNFLLLQLFKNFVGARYPYLLLFLTCLLLSFTTGVDFYCGQISADIFSGIIILTVFLIYFLNNPPFWKIAFLTLIFGFSLISHLSHIPLSLALIGIILIVELLRRRFRKKRFQKLNRIVLLVATLALSLLTLATVNYSFGAGFKLSRASNIVIGARMIESGIANEYLKRNCGKPNFNPPYKNLCNYVDKFDQWPAAGFYLHIQDSPLYDGPCNDIDWTTCWTEKDSSYGVLISDILKENDLRNHFIAMAISGTLKQLFYFEQPKIDPQQFSSVFIDYYQYDNYRFETSSQLKEPLKFIEENRRQVFIVDLSFLLLMLFFILNWRSIDYQTKLLALYFLIALLANAFICATFSNVVERYQDRIIFLIPLLLILVVLRHINLNIKNYQLSLSDLFKKNSNV